MTSIANVLVGGHDPLGQLTTTIAPILERLDALRTAGLHLPAADIATALATLLDMPVSDLAKKGWQQHRDVEAARASTAANPGFQEVVRLLEHRVESRHAPALEITVNGVPREVLALELLVEIEAANVDLVVRNGEIDEVRSGPAIARGTLSASEIVLASHEFQTVDLGP
ncbi:MAG TPA: hypothetical protein VJ978_10220 [Nitriliruptoraceae bacterium]|nr:hypothetical protein [Nitriliruptoraceae bacterium]